METKPLPCPFCGSENIVYNGPYGTTSDFFNIGCDDCGAQIEEAVSYELAAEADAETVAFITRASLLEAWNTRVPV